MTTEPLEPPETDDPKKLQKWAGTKLSLSLALTLYFKPPPRRYADGMLDVYKRFLEICEPRLTWFADETGKRYREAKADVLRIPFDRVSQALDNGKTYTWGAFAGKHHRHAAPFQFFGFLEPDEYRQGDIGFLRAAFGVDSYKEDFGRFVALVKELSALAPVFHGTAGFSFSESMVDVQAQANEPYKIAAAAHFAGVEVEEPLATSLSCQKAIKGINWLTMIDASFVKQLGGEKTLRALLSEAITLHRMPWGLMLQAGPAPGLGVVNMGETLPLYREVNKALRSVRVAVHQNLGVLFDEAHTRRWIGRFD